MDAGLRGAAAIVKAVRGRPPVPCALQIGSRSVEVSIGIMDKEDDHAAEAAHPRDKKEVFHMATREALG